jgi:quaternary ammonium compound-resistance protein SugE
MTVLKLMGPWPVLVMAGLLEVTWAVGLKASDGFKRPVASSVTVIAMIGSLYLLAAALRELPVSTGYAVWTGIGALGTAIVGMAFLGEPRSALRVASILLIVAGIIGLRVATGARG